jgi:Protein of unknown function (DUF3352)
MSRTLLLRACAALVAVAAIAVPVAGCGSSSSAGGNAGVDPARFLPASTPLYLEALVRPEGDLKANVEAVARKLLRTDDPTQKITGLIDKALRDQGASYKTDIEPWLGDRVGFALTGIGAGADSGDGVAALASRDDGKAQAFVDGRKNTEKRSYRGVAYRYDGKQDIAAAVVDHAVIVGSERAFKSAIDATKGARLADAKAFREARDSVTAEGIGFAYLDPSRLFDIALGAAGGKGSGQQAQALKGLVAGSGLRSIGAALEVAQNALRVDAAVIGIKAGKGSGDGPGAAADVPAGSWLSVGIGDVGAAISSALSQLGNSGAIGPLDPETLLAQLKSGLGVDVRRDFLSWMGDTALFVRGTSKDRLNGALVVHSTDPAASQRAIGVLRDLLPKLGAKVESLPGGSGAEGLRVPLGSGGPTVDIAAQGDRFVIAIGPGALDAALGSSPRLGDSSAYKTAAGLLGGARPSLFLDTPQVVRLVGQSVSATERVGFDKARPTLDAFGPAAAAVTPEGDKLRVKAAVEVR